MELLTSQGEIRASYSLDQIQEGIETLVLASNQVPYNILNLGIEKDLVRLIPFKIISG